MTLSPTPPATAARSVFSFDNCAGSNAIEPIALFASGTDPDWPVSHLQDPRMYRTWRSGGDGAVQLDWHYNGATRRHNVFGLMDTSAVDGLTVRLELFSGGRPGAGAPVYDTGELPALFAYPAPSPTFTPPWGTFQWGGRPPAAVLAHYPRNFLHLVMDQGGEAPALMPHGSGRITLSAGHPSGYWEAGLLWIGDAWQPPRGMERGWGHGYRQAGGTLTESTTTGSIESQGLVIKPQITDLQWRFLRRVDLDAALRLVNLTHATGAPLVAVLEPGRPERYHMDAGLWRLESLVQDDAEPVWKAGEPTWSTEPFILDAWR